MKNPKLIEKLALNIRQEEQLASLAVESFDALIKIKNYRDVPSKSLEARFCETPLAHQLTEIKSANKVPHKHHLYDRNDEHFNIDHLPKMII